MTKSGKARAPLGNDVIGPSFIGVRVIPRMLTLFWPVNDHKCCLSCFVLFFKSLGRKIHISSLKGLKKERNTSLTF